MLLEAGADLDAASNDKGTAYDYAQGLALPPSARLTSYILHLTSCHIDIDFDYASSHNSYTCELLLNHSVGTAVRPAGVLQSGEETRS